MNGIEYISALADIPDDLIRSASDDAAVRKVFRQHRSRRNRILGALCCCIVVAAAAGVGTRNWFRQTPAALPEEPTNAGKQQTVSPAGLTPSGEASTDGTENRQPTAAAEQPVPPAKETDPHAANTAPPAERQPTSDPDRGEPTTQTTSDDASVIWGTPGVAEASAFVTWNGKQVGYELWEVLKKDTKGKTIAIVAAPHINAQFAYNGKTIAEYEARASEESWLPEKMRQLLKEGDLLKYGESLYTTGAPNGEKWARSFYEERIAFYGTDMLSKYIVNGRFLADRLTADIQTVEADTTAAFAYNEAVSAFFSQTSAAAAAAFSAAGLSCSVSESGDAILFFASAERFAGLADPGNAEWYYYLAQQNPGETVTRA